MTPKPCLLAVLFFVAFGFGEDVQQRADGLIQHARELSDIRSPNAPAFRLRATFSFTGEDLETIQGTFTETWVSNAQWRRETKAMDLHRLEVGGTNRRWLAEDSKELPMPAAGVPAIMDIFPSRFGKLGFESIRDRNPQDTGTECAITKPFGADEERSAFCFDKRSGVLVERISPEPIGIRVADYACQYGAFSRFGKYLFPRQIDCFLDGHRKLQANITELMLEPSPDAALFVPPAGSIELGNCSGKAESPQPVSTPEPSFPRGYRDRSYRGRSTRVMLSLIVDKNGKTQGVKVLRSGGKAFDEEAVNNVHSWRFKAATCDGETVATQMSIEIKFQLR